MSDKATCNLCGNPDAERFMFGGMECIACPCVERLGLGDVVFMPAETPRPLLTLIKGGKEDA